MRRAATGTGNWKLTRNNRQPMALKPGEEAPDFELRSHRGGTVRLSDFRGKKNVVLAFHPLAFTPVCATQMSGYESNLPRLERDDAVVLGISIDPQPSKTAWAKTLGPISFDLLSDFHPARRGRAEVRRLPAEGRLLGAGGLRRRQGRADQVVEDLRHPAAAGQRGAARRARPARQRLRLPHAEACPERTRSNVERVSRRE